MRTIIIDSAKRIVEEAEVDDVRAALGCGYVDRAFSFPNGDRVYVDDAAMIGPPQAAFAVADSATTWPGWPFEGRGIVLARDGGAPKSSVEEVRRAVQFFTIRECYEERCRLKGESRPAPP